jgi:hypothetical protein
MCGGVGRSSLAPVIRQRLTYANVMATIAVVLSLGGTTAFAAGQLRKNSVGAGQLRKDSVTGAKVKDGSLGGADVNAATLGTVPTAAHAQTAGRADSAGVADSAKRADAAAPTGPAGGDLIGAFPNPTVAPKAIDASKLADGSVTAPKLADDAVGADAIAPQAVGKEAIAHGAVGAPALRGIDEVRADFFGSGIIHGPTSVNELSVSCPDGTTLLSGGFATSVIGGANIESSRRRSLSNTWVVTGTTNGTVNIPVQVYAYCLEG